MEEQLAQNNENRSLEHGMVQVMSPTGVSNVGKS